jgi:MFS family permease
MSSAAGSPLATPSPPDSGSTLRTTIVLGVGALGLAWSLTTTAAYLPPLLERFTGSTTLIALVLAAEGVFALTLPLVIGPWSDTFHTPLGRRRPFMLVAIGPIGFCLALMAFMPSLWTTALLVFAFFFAYYVYEPPYRGLYPDVLPERIFGRAQGVQHLFRGVALGAALIGGGVLFHVWKPAPFLVAAVVVTAACLVPILFVQEDGGHGRVFEGIGTYVRHSWRVLRRNPEVGRFLLANAAWEGTFAGARTFVVLYITVGLGEPLFTSTLALAAVAAGYIVAALVSGPIGDRLGLARVITACSIVYGLGLLAGGFARSWHDWYLPVIFFVALFAGSVMTLAWGLLFKLMPAGDRGAISGLATTTKGLGLLVGPLLAGALIDILRPTLPATHGYQVLWPVLGVPILLAIPLVASLIAAEGRSAAGELPGGDQGEAPDGIVDDRDDGAGAPAG